MNTAVTLLCSFLLASFAFAGAKIDPSLVQFAQGRSNETNARIVALLQAPSSSAPNRYDSAKVLRYLRQLSRSSSSSVQQQLATAGVVGKGVKIERFFWINNSLVASVTPEGLRALANVSGVTKIYRDRNLSRDKERPGRRNRLPLRRAALSIESESSYAFREAGLADLITSQPQIDGRGVVLGQVDTGVDGAHPALQGKIAAFWDPAKKGPGTPVDSGTHGTHTAGTMIGGDRTSNLIGVAPGAKLVAAGSVGSGRYDDMIASMEFMVDPDGNPETKDMPRAINNSWNCNGAPDVELFYKAIGAWEAASILPVFSAGNAGPMPSSITRPHEYPTALAVGATGGDGKITYFSSRGPGKFRDLVTQKPDLTAPGDKIVSSVPGGSYEEMSGTSMASPHVTGATALLYQVDPLLSPEQIRKILFTSIVPTNEDGMPGTTGAWNPVYGLGKLNVAAAVALATKVHNTRMRGGRPNGFMFFSPDDLTIDSILDERDVSVSDLLEYPEALEGDTWVQSEAIFL